MLTMTSKIVRVNHVKELCKRMGWVDRRTAIRELVYNANVTIPTAIKAYDGNTDLGIDTVERLALVFGVTKEEVLESRYR